MAVYTLGGPVDLYAYVKGLSDEKILVNGNEVSWQEFMEGPYEPDYANVEEFNKHGTTILAVLRGIWTTDSFTLTKQHVERVELLLCELDHTQRETLRSKIVPNALGYKNNFQRYQNMAKGGKHTELLLRMLPLPGHLGKTQLFFYVLKLIGTTFAKQMIEHEVKVQNQMKTLQLTLLIGRHTQIDLTHFEGRDFVAAVVEVIMSAHYENNNLMYQTLLYCLSSAYHSTDDYTGKQLLMHLCVVPMEYAMPLISALLSALRGPRLIYTNENIYKNTISSIFKGPKGATLNLYSDTFFENLLEILNCLDRSVPLFYHCLIRSGASKLKLTEYVVRLLAALKNREVRSQCCAQYLYVTYLGSDGHLRAALPDQRYTNNWKNYNHEDEYREDYQQRMQVDHDVGGNKCPLPPPPPLTRGK
ncbi:ORF89 [Ranid herpesvirus 2]|uniref:ORF89 n=1 Tax=Ranid herpesvirus 2 TaxID=389214 RepID=Q14W17_9VIRU|nr:ORF89 [Ranid herpesvirus 2]ABG25611.1 ORF89 [Ranid herpesvirus 2]